MSFLVPCTVYVKFAQPGKLKGKGDLLHVDIIKGHQGTYPSHLTHLLIVPILCKL